MCLLDWYKLRAENLEELCMSLGLLAVALLPGLTDPSHQRGGQLALPLSLLLLDLPTSLSLDLNVAIPPHSD